MLLDATDLPAALEYAPFLVRSYRDTDLFTAGVEVCQTFLIRVRRQTQISAAAATVEKCALRYNIIRAPPENRYRLLVCYILQGRAKKKPTFQRLPRRAGLNWLEQRDEWNLAA
jgi:hypothetical protein